jgi:hypothetical protein
MMVVNLKVERVTEIVHRYGDPMRELSNISEFCRDGLKNFYIINEDLVQDVSTWPYEYLIDRLNNPKVNGLFI